MNEAGPAAADELADDGHDHAWSHVRGEVDYGTSMEYQCDVCDLRWSL